MNLYDPNSPMMKLSKLVNSLQPLGAASSLNQTYDCISPVAKYDSIQTAFDLVSALPLNSYNQIQEVLQLSRLALSNISTSANTGLFNILSQLQEIAEAISKLSLEALDSPCSPQTSIKIQKTVKKIIEDAIDESLTKLQFNQILEKKPVKSKWSYLNILNLILTVTFGVSSTLSGLGLEKAMEKNNILQQEEISLQQEANAISKEILETNKELIDAVNRLADALE